MSEPNKEPWLNYLALTTVIFAVCATLATFKGGGFSTRSVMSQSEASDQWAYYQAKGIKSYLYRMQEEKLELELMTLEQNSRPSAIAVYKQKIAEYQAKEQKYEQERQQIETTAKQFEHVRDQAQQHSGRFGIAVIFLQIAILLSSVAGLLKRKSIWQLGLLAGLVGIVYFADGFLLFF